MFKITKEFQFSASHVLDLLPGWHPCARMHGHNYTVVLELSAGRDELTDVGFVRDFRDLDPVKKWIDETLDHRHLNETMDGLSPSSELLAAWIFDHWIGQLPELTAVFVSETPKTMVEYRPARHLS